MKLFISYRHEDWTFVHPLAKDIKKLIDGTLFIDYHDIDEANFERSILCHLEECDVVLVVVTGLTFAPYRINQIDDWIRRELAHALKKNKPLVLIRVGNQQLPSQDELPTNIRNVLGMQAISFNQGYYTEGVQHLVAFINKITGSKEDSSPILRRAQDALLRGNYVSAKRDLEKAVNAFEEDQMPKRAAKANYLLALVVLGGKRPFVQSLSTMRSAENFINSALALYHSYSYLLTLALFKLDFARNGLPQLVHEAQELINQASQIAQLPEDAENLKLLSLCQPGLTHDYLD